VQISVLFLNIVANRNPNNIKFKQYELKLQLFQAKIDSTLRIKTHLELLIQSEANYKLLFLCLNNHIAKYTFGFIDVGIIQKND